MNAGLLKPCYVFSPANLLRRIYIHFFGCDGDEACVKLPWGGRVHVSMHDSIGMEIYKQRSFDIGVSECAWRLLKSNGRVIDAGANLGYMTLLFAARVGPSGTVHSFEPHPIILERLRKNILSHAQVELHECALGEASGMAELSEPEQFGVNQGTATLAGSESSVARSGKTHRVPVTSLDTAFPQESFDLLKVDVEGYEESVFRGAQKMLREKRVRHIIYEDHTQGAGSVPESLKAYGYSIFSIGYSLRGLLLRPIGEEVALDTRWESASYIATLEPAEVRTAAKRWGWMVLNGRGE